MIKIMLKRKKESDTYLATDSRHRWSAQMTMITKFSFQPAVRRLLLQLMKAAVPAESYI